jgi:hypothetical protein
MEHPTVLFNIKYEIIGRVDGRWVVRAFDSKHQPLGTEVTVDTPTDAWRIFMLLNGYSDAEPTEILERMEYAS